MRLPFENRKFEVLVKKTSIVSSETFFRSAKELVNNCIVILNKPKGPTSHQVSDIVKNIFKAEKAGHTGTLDPIVTGVLPVCVNNATKLVKPLLTAGKEYVCLMRLHKLVDKKQLDFAFEKFRGTIKQLPPVKSSVKREVRERTVYYIDVLEIDGQNVLFKIGCEAGTYIRKVCFDLGKFLGINAHMQELVRTKAGPFKLKDAVTLQDLEDALWFWKNENNESYLRKCLLPIENAAIHLPKIWVLDTTITSLIHGASLKVPGIAQLNNDVKKEDTVAILSLNNELICIGTALMNSEEIMKEEKGVAVKVDRVIKVVSDL